MKSPVVCKLYRPVCSECRSESPDGACMKFALERFINWGWTMFMTRNTRRRRAYEAPNARLGASVKKEGLCHAGSLSTEVA